MQKKISISLELDPQGLQSFFSDFLIALNQQPPTPPTSQPSQSLDELMTIQEAADFLHLKKSTVYSLVQRREIPVNKRGNRLYFSKGDLIEWVKTGRKKTNKELADVSSKFLSHRKGR